MTSLESCLVSLAACSLSLFEPLAGKSSTRINSRLRLFAQTCCVKQSQFLSCLQNELHADDIRAQHLYTLDILTRMNSMIMISVQIIHTRNNQIFIGATKYYKGRDRKQRGI
jgi:hypothetical protein